MDIERNSRPVNNAEEESIKALLVQYGGTVIKNPHAGLPGHEDDPTQLFISEAPEMCPPFIEALLRANDDEQRQAIINIYKIPEE